MRTRLFALATLAPLLLVVVAHADDEDPYIDPAAPAASPGVPALPPLPDLPALPELPPLVALVPLTPLSSPGVPAEPAPAPAPSPAPAPPPASSPTLLSLPAVRGATLGQYDEYRRDSSAYSIDSDPVHAHDYERCVAAGQCTRPSCATASPEARVTCVDLKQASAYCAFAGERLPTEDEWEHAARQANGTGMHATDDAAEWTSTPYCFFCGKNDEVVRGGPARNPSLRGWRAPAAHDADLGFRCAKGGTA